MEMWSLPGGAFAIGEGIETNEIKRTGLTSFEGNATEDTQL